MKRVSCTPRPDWQSKVAATGVTYHTPSGTPYWDESSCYEFLPEEIAILETTARELRALCQQAAEAILERNWWNRLGVDPHMALAAAHSWKCADRPLLERFDLAWDGHGAPKLLECNADTPMTLIEAAQTQHHWRIETMPCMGQWNSIHQALVHGLKEMPAPTMHFTGILSTEEDRQMLCYLARAAVEAGRETILIPIHRLGWHRQLQCFVDEERRPIEWAYKLYPWDWLWAEGFSQHPEWPSQILVEPIWKVMWNSKGLLAILWELFPGHPNLLPCYAEPAPLHGNYVRKPRLGREGCNIEYFRNSQRIGFTEGPYARSGFVYQALAPAQPFDGFNPTLGVWIIAGQPCGLGIREDTRLIVKDNSRFVPHCIISN